MTRYVFDVDGEHLDGAAFAARWPAWVQDPAGIQALTRQPTSTLQPSSPVRPPGSLFAPWRDAILATAAPHQALLLGRDPVAAGPDASFGHGTAAFLPSSDWPRCGACGAPLELCCQLAPHVMRPWIRKAGALVLMYCFRCCPRHSSDGGEAVFLRMVEPRTLATRPAGPTSSSSPTSTTRTLGVEVRPPSWQVPGAMWFRYRLDGEDLGGAAAILLGREEVVVEERAEAGDRDEGDEGDEGDELDVFNEYDAWADEVNSSDRRSCGALGGYARWDQDDATPACAGCGAPMQLLVDWSGEQFLDGALHVFLCDRTPACREDLAFVAEF